VYRSAIFTAVDLFALNFYLDSVIAINHFWHQELEALGYLVVYIRYSKENVKIRTGSPSSLLPSRFARESTDQIALGDF